MAGKRVSAQQRAFIDEVVMVSGLHQRHPIRQRGRNHIRMLQSLERQGFITLHWAFAEGTARNFVTGVTVLDDGLLEMLV